MIWVILSVLAGLGDAISFALMKKLSNLDGYVLLTSRHLATLPFLFFAFFFYDVPSVTLNFYIVTLLNVIILVVSIFLIIKSLQTSDLSATIPMLSFTPIFLLLVAYLLLKEVPSILGFMGIIIVVIGSYIAHISSIKYGYLEPFKLIFKNKGVLYMFIVAFLFSISATLSKIGINMSNPAYFVFITYLFASFILLILFFKRFVDMGLIKKNSKYIVMLGI